MRSIVLAAVASTVIPTALAWGAAGHEIVATIAQIHLHPNVRTKLCSILPPQAKCHLAPVAAWADQVKWHYPGSAPMHYVNPKLDHPADHCEFGEHGWVNEDVNVLTAIMNQTARIMAGEGDIPLRFLVHYVGDMHQPLHLTGRDRGGNQAMMSFEGRHRNLHSVWDGGLITKKIRELGNYTSRVPSKQIESSLPGAIFDPYVRWIVWEGIREWWKESLEEWLACPSGGDPFPHSSVASVPPSHPSWLKNIKGLSSFLLNFLPSPMATALTIKYPFPLKETDQLVNQMLSQHPTSRHARLLRANGEFKAVDNELPACPYTWSKKIHQLNCDYVWPKDYTGAHGAPLIELDTPQYLGRIDGDKVVEKLLAMGGIRLASILNTVFGETEAEKGVYFSY